MGQVVIHATMSLDGYIAGPSDDMSWMSDYVGPNKSAERLVKSVGAIVWRLASATPSSSERMAVWLYPLSMATISVSSGSSKH